MMVAAITAMPPPCGVGTPCEERAFGLARAMRLSHGRIAMMIATLMRGRYNQGSDCGRSLQGCSTMAHAFAHRQACCPPRSVCRLCQIFLAHTATINPRLSRKVCR